MATSRSAAVRERLDHPVIDADGHTIEFGPGVAEKLRELAGDDAARRFQGAGGFGWYRMSPEQRRDARLVRPPWWALPSENTLDRATAMLPRLLHERLDETRHRLRRPLPDRRACSPPRSRTPRCDGPCAARYNASTPRRSASSPTG